MTNGKLGTILILVTALVLLIVTGCTTAPEPVAEPDPVREAPAIEPEPAPEIAEPVNDEFVVTEEIYQQTFEDIEAFIANLNAIIRNEDYEAWRSFLTDEYINYYSDPDVLKSISEELKRKYSYDLRLRSLKDYFIYIVVGSRHEAELDEIEFIDEERLLAYSIVNGTPVILYYLANNEGRWKIARWQ